MVDISLQRTQNQPEQKPYIFLYNGKTESGSLNLWKIQQFSFETSLSHFSALQDLSRIVNPWLRNGFYVMKS